MVNLADMGLGSLGFRNTGEMAQKTTHPNEDDQNKSTQNPIHLMSRKIRGSNTVGFHDEQMHRSDETNNQASQPKRLVEDVIAGFSSAPGREPIILTRQVNQSRRQETNGKED